MKSNITLAIVLIVLGAAILGYQQFSYKTEDKILDLGPIHATTEHTHSVAVPPIIGWALIASGAGVLIFSTRARA